MVKLPDFDDLQKIIDEIRDLEVEVGIAKIRIKDVENAIVRESVTNPKFFMNGKAPSMAYVESTLKFSGIDGELLPAREALVKLEADLEHKKLTLDLMNSIIAVWRTEQANQRRSEL